MKVFVNILLSCGATSNSTNLPVVVYIGNSLVDSLFVGASQSHIGGNCFVSRARNSIDIALWFGNRAEKIDLA
jgi:hypothetical protein